MSDSGHSHGTSGGFRTASDGDRSASPVRTDRERSHTPEPKEQGHIRSDVEEDTSIPKVEDVGHRKYHAGVDFRPEELRGTGDKGRAANTAPVSVPGTLQPQIRAAPDSLTAEELEHRRGRGMQELLQRSRSANASAKARSGTPPTASGSSPRSRSEANTRSLQEFLQSRYNAGGGQFDPTKPLGPLPQTMPDMQRPGFLPGASLPSGQNLQRPEFMSSMLERPPSSAGTSYATGFGRSAASDADSRYTASFGGSPNTRRFDVARQPETFPILRPVERAPLEYGPAGNDASIAQQFTLGHRLPFGMNTPVSSLQTSTAAGSSGDRSSTGDLIAAMAAGTTRPSSASTSGGQPYVFAAPSAPEERSGHDGDRYAYPQLNRPQQFTVGTMEHSMQQHAFQQQQQAVSTQLPEGVSTVQNIDGSTRVTKQAPKWLRPGGDPGAQSGHQAVLPAAPVTDGFGKRYLGPIATGDHRPGYSLIPRPAVQDPRTIVQDPSAAGPNAPAYGGALPPTVKTLVSSGGSEGVGAVPARVSSLQAHPVVHLQQTPPTGTPNAAPQHREEKPQQGGGAHSGVGGVPKKEQGSGGLRVRKPDGGPGDEDDEEDFSKQKCCMRVPPAIRREDCDGPSNACSVCGRLVCVVHRLPVPGGIVLCPLNHNEPPPDRDLPEREMFPPRDDPNLSFEEMIEIHVFQQVDKEQYRLFSV